MDPRRFWDDKFKHARYAYGTAPNAFLAAQVAHFPAQGAIASLGEGEGRNAVFLAEQGFEVTGYDASGAGLAKLARLASERGVTVRAVETDLCGLDLGSACWDGIVNVYCHMAPEDRAAMYARIRAALKPGGAFLTEQFSIRQLGYKSGGPKDEQLLLTLAELLAAFDGWKMAVAAEEIVTLNEGPLHQGPAAVVRFVAHKPEAERHRASGGVV